MNHTRIATVLSVCLPFAASAQDPAADSKALAAALNRFGAALHRQLGTTGAPTASPASIAFTLAMLLPGARGDTAAELAAGLQLPDELRGERLHAAVHRLLTDSGIAAPAKPGGPQLRLANDLWVQRGLSLDPGYTATLRRSFAAGHHLLDFRSAPDAARRQINAAIAKATKDRIAQLLGEDDVTAVTRTVLTNAIWFQAAWHEEFPEGATRDDPFTLGDGTAVRVPTMHRQSHFAYAATDAWQCVALAFADSTLHCELIVPRDGHTLATAEAALLAGEPMAALQGAKVDVSLPRFRIQSRHRLREALLALGFRTIFDPASADFRGITTTEPLVVDNVVHECWIQVDERGAEAAAATATTMRAGSAARPETVHTFRADRPFAFLLRDRRTGLVLFVGRVDDPRVGRTQAADGTPGRD